MTVVEDIGKGSNLSPLRLYSCVDMDGVIKITNGEANEKEAVSYKCVQCGAPLTFLPGDDKVTCEYCGKKYTVQEIETLYGNPSDKPGTEEKEKKAAEGKAGAAQEKEKGASDSEKGEQAEWDARLADHAWSEEDKKQFRTFVCPSCGAELMTDATTMATTCCYCGNPTMIPGRFSGSYRPDWIIPFKKTRDDARKALEAFYRGKRLLPDDFKAKNHVDKLQGLYVPFWLFSADCTGRADYQGTRKRYYETSDARIINTDHYRVMRKGEVSFDKIPVDGSSKMDDLYMESIEPFDYDNMETFTPAYFTGYVADTYDISHDDSEKRADSRLSSSFLGMLEATATPYYVTLSAEDGSIYKTRSNVSYAMVPVWIVTTRYKDKPYTFMMNGQTGVFVGSLPIDKGKLARWTWGTFFIIFIISLGIMEWVMGGLG